MQVKKLKEYCKLMLLDVEIQDKLLILEDKVYSIITDNRDLFGEDMEFIGGDVGIEGVFGFVFEFGGRWYLHEKDTEVTLDELKYKGNVNQRIATKSFLGIRSGYELMNGIGLYNDWIEKAKFLGITALGICEKHTLAGVLEFQSKCIKEDIKPITGLTIVVQEGEDRYEVKLYAKNFEGWLNLLKFNSHINVEQNTSITINFLDDNSGGLFIIADPKSMDIKYLHGVFDFYMLDTVRFLNEDTDKWYINNLESFMKSDIEPISITDAFYLEKCDFITREVLWSIGKTFDHKTNNQYFKNKDQYASELIKMFASEDKSWIHLYKTAGFNEDLVVKQCNFEYDVDTRHLPKYVMTDKQASEFKTNEKLFLYLLKVGFKEKKITDIGKYIDRLKLEIEVLKAGDVIDYFLSTWDIMKYAKSEKMLTGIARGSAGGCLVAYLLDIIKINPLEFELLFERFLNSGRMGEYKDRPSYKIEQEDGTIIELSEGSLVSIERDGIQTSIFVHDLKEGDNLLKH